jgi:mannosyltransferase
LLAVAAVSLAAKRISGYRARLAAGLFLALMPGVARYSQEGRVYAIALALSALSMWFLVEFTHSGNRRWIIAYAVALFFLAPIAPFALTVLIGQAIIIAMNSEYRKFIKIWLISLSGLVPGLSLQLYAASKISSQHDWVPEPTLGGLFKGILWPGALPASGDVAVVVSAVVIAAWALLLSTRQANPWAIATIAGLLTLWIVSMVFVNFWIVRSALPLSIFLVIGAGIALARTPLLNIAVISLLLFAFTWPDYSGPRQLGGRAEDVKAAALIVEEFGMPGDVINTKSRGWLEFGVKRYVPNADQFSYSDSSLGRAWIFSGDARDIECDQIEEWQIPGNGFLTLCSSLPNGWRATFQ